MIDRVLDAKNALGLEETIDGVREAQHALAQMAALEVAALQSEAEKLRQELLQAEAKLQMMRSGVNVPSPSSSPASSPAAAAATASPEDAASAVWLAKQHGSRLVHGGGAASATKSNQYS